MYLKHFGSELEANGLRLNGKRVHKRNYVRETKADFLIVYITDPTITPTTGHPNPSKHYCIFLTNVLGCTCGT